MGSAAAQLAGGEEKLKESKETFEDTKEEAYDSADLNNILTMETLTNLLTAQNFSMPAGYIEDQGTEILVRVGDKLEDKEELAGLLLFDTGDEGIGRIYLRDVADISVESNAGELYAKINGENGLLLSFTKQSTYSTALVSKNIGERFGALSEEYEGLKFTTLMDQGNYIYIVVDTVLQNLVLGAVLAVLILLLFLKDLRPTVVIAFSIPIHHACRFWWAPK